MHRLLYCGRHLASTISRTTIRPNQGQAFSQWRSRQRIAVRPVTRPLVHSTQQRFLSRDLKNEVGKAWKQHRIILIILIGGIGIAAWTLTLSVVQYFQLYWLPKYPQPVQEKLRRAVYYKIIDFKPQESIKYLKEALIAADKCGMDPYSDAVIGIRVQAVEVMEKAEAYKEAIRVLEHMKASNISVSMALERPGSDDDQVKRTRLLLWSVRFAVKLGEMYGRPEIWNRPAAEANFKWAATTVLRESQRRLSSNVTDEIEGPWMSTEELGATLESLASTYESQNQYYLAAPLYLYAINLRTVKDCHTVVLMNNLASCLSQQSPQAATAVKSILDATSTEHRPDDPLTRAMLLDSAATWARNALGIAEQIKPPIRDEECDVGCAVALHNLGEIAEMKREFDEARRKYGEAISLARAIGFQEGIEQSSVRLDKLKDSVK